MPALASPPRRPPSGVLLVYFDGACAHCRRLAALLRRLDLAARLDLRSFRADDGYRAHGLAAEELERALHVVRGGGIHGRVHGHIHGQVHGQASAGFAALVEIARALPLAWPLLPLLLLGRLSGWGEPLYRWVAARRFALGAGSCASGACAAREARGRAAHPAPQRRVGRAAPPVRSNYPVTMAELPEQLARPARRALAQAGYSDLEQLSNVSDSELLNLHGFGPKALLLLKAALAEAGLSTTEQPQGAQSPPASEGAKTGKVVDERP